MGSNLCFALVDYGGYKTETKFANFYWSI